MRMADDSWTDEDDAHFAMATLPPSEPVALTLAVWNALTADEDHTSLLREFVTPESLEQWGDFSAARDALSAPRLGIIGTARQYPDAVDVAYVWITRQAGDTARMTDGPEVVEIAETFTWIWHADREQWLLHSIGTMLDPGEMPRTSPNRAPKIDAISPTILE